MHGCVNAFCILTRCSNTLPGRSTVDCSQKGTHFSHAAAPFLNAQAFKDFHQLLNRISVKLCA